MAALDIVLLNLVIAGGVTDGDGALVFPRDDAIVRKVIFGFDVRGDEIGFDNAIWINDVHQQIQWTMGTHAGEIWSHIAAFAFELVAGGAILRKEFMAIFNIAGFLDGGRQ